MKPYPTIEEAEKASGDPELLWDRIEPEALIRIICNLDRARDRTNCAGLVFRDSATGQTWGGAPSATEQGSERREAPAEVVSRPDNRLQYTQEQWDYAVWASCLFAIRSTRDSVTECANCAPDSECYRAKRAELERAISANPTKGLA